ncbi:saccharopine dehydrogenase [Gordonia sp. TBRC 11910]|uniref:Saccharopine dehydrogenase n=1 Tax=Gordonia asplenii TaxID=2725283 RepID=A0A848L250_9ACTN|nr:saccharopine dehydrogenase NADP-binding domain-containing protein [Gordonia asplenii]NMO03165.1 saccharopine dehydrogenase [Gordonia asplenii]
MLVTVVGGAGAMGRKAVETLATFDEVSEVQVLDRDVEPLTLLTLDEHCRRKIRPVVVDALADDLASHFAGSAVVLSTLGPFTIFGERVLSAAIDAAVDYVDINDDWEPTLEALEWHARAQAAGVTALIGMGASPGVSNVLAARAAAELDVVHELYTGWVVAGTESEPGGARPAAAILHLVHECTGKVRVVEGGVDALVTPLEPMRLHYPGLGDIDVRTIGHPETVTLPRRYPDLRRCYNVMAGPAWWFGGIAPIMAAVDAGELSVHDAALRVEDGISRPVDAPRTRRTPSLWALAVGERAGVPTRTAVSTQRWSEGRMAGATAIPAAVSARMLLRGQISRPGVNTPEDLVPFDLLMESLDPLYTLPDAAGPLFDITSEPIVGADAQ